MRVISGTARGKRLKSPADRKVRPTLDRVKENIFNMIGPSIRDSVAADLFAGSGALGIEALSRGARICYFSDMDEKSVAFVKDNLRETKLQERAEVYRMDARQVIEKLFQDQVKLDYLFIDPPYLKGIVQKILKQLGKYNIMQVEGIVIIETDKNEILPEEVAGLIKTKDRIYSGTRVSIFVAKGGEQNEQ